RRRHADADPARRRGVAGGGVTGALLVPHEDVPHRGVEERVVDREDRAAGDAEDDVGADRLEGAYDRRRARHGLAGRGRLSGRGDGPRLRRRRGPRRRRVRDRGRHRSSSWARAVLETLSDMEKPLGPGWAIEGRALSEGTSVRPSRWRAREV